MLNVSVLFKGSGIFLLLSQIQNQMIHRNIFQTLFTCKKSSPTPQTTHTHTHTHTDLRSLFQSPRLQGLSTYTPHQAYGQDVCLGTTGAGAVSQAGARSCWGPPLQGLCAFTLPHVGAFTAEWPVQGGRLAGDRLVAGTWQHLGGGGRPGIPPEEQHSGPQGQAHGWCLGGSPPLKSLHLQEGRTMKGESLQLPWVKS